jgi:four helix bundle protein
MATYKTYKDMEIWQRARLLCKDIYKVINNDSLSKDFRLRDQMNGSSGSIMDNIAEGFERDGKNEFKQFLSYAKGSAGELSSQLHRALDRDHISQEEFDKLHTETLEIASMIGGFIIYLMKTEYKGNKFKEPEAIYLLRDEESDTEL